MSAHLLNEFTEYNTLGYDLIELKIMNDNWERKVVELQLEPGSDEYSNQLKWFSDNLSRKGVI